MARMEGEFQEQSLLRTNDEHVCNHQNTVEGREKRLFEASVNGSVNSLKQLMEEDPLILARASVTCFDETPLHIAAMLGHLHLATLLATHNPGMAMAIDFKGRSPLHLASANGSIDIVTMLLALNSDLCLVCDEDGRTPLHLAVMKGHVGVTRELVMARPEATGYKLDHGETILHSSVRHNRLGALKLLIDSVKEPEFLNASDEDGNTVLHTAVSLKQLETVRYLLNGVMTLETINAVNISGLTALDLIENTPRDSKSMKIRKKLSEVGAFRARNVPDADGDYCEIAMTMEKPGLQTEDVSPRASKPQGGNTKKTRTRSRNGQDWLKDKREALMVTAGVLAAMAYQAGLNPPGGLWQDDENGHKAGTSIMGYHSPNSYKFWIYNTVALLSSLSTIFLIISGIPTKKRFVMWMLMMTMSVTITCTALAYLSSLSHVSPDNQWNVIGLVVTISILSWLGLIMFVCLVHFVRFLIWCVKKVRKVLKWLCTCGS